MWQTLEIILLDRKAYLIHKLIQSHDDEIRGAIKEIDFIIGLPQRLQQEAMSINQHELPDTAREDYLTN